MAFKTLILLFLNLAIFSYQMMAQDCLEYPEIGGTECSGCVPDGWVESSATSPDIVPDDGSFPAVGCVNDLSGPSPSGGNISLFVSAGPGYQEGMTTTVSGLNVNQEYGFGLYWEEVTLGGQCGDYIPGELLITIDGEEYEYEGAQSWELIQCC